MWTWGSGCGPVTPWGNRTVNHAKPRKILKCVGGALLRRGMCADGIRRINAGHYEMLRCAVSAVVLQVHCSDTRKTSAEGRVQNNC